MEDVLLLMFHMQIMIKLRILIRIMIMIWKILQIKQKFAEYIVPNAKCAVELFYIINDLY